ncbi:uncharacterized protein LOC126736755 [Anthonomus grandis grandis]|uniref:uncharacterized protein LOC126736755 n=1 Tax=Anthonomus grandis grandis TaxID=2921223 RepID=UPI00216581A8|nr:uncharacterized protein LOC126736755 [Anthonomus grandis grandis]
MRWLLLLFFGTLAIAENVHKVSSSDSYLDAYQETKTNAKVTKAQKKSDGVYPVYSGNAQYFGPSDSFQPNYGPLPSSYGSPSNHYGPPIDNYGPSIDNYGPPSPQYGPPVPNYGPGPAYGSFAEPAPQYGPPIYGPPAQNLQVFYGVPHAMISIWDKLWEKIKWKLDLLTIGKIILKLIIFKKIVNFIAIIFLLLFIPSLKHKKGFFSTENDEAERGIQNTGNVIDERLQNIASFVSQSIEKYSTLESQDADCSTVYCRIQRDLKNIKNETTYNRLVELYARDFESSQKKSAKV